MKEIFEYIIYAIFILLVSLMVGASVFLFAFGPLILIAHNDDDDDDNNDD